MSAALFVLAVLRSKVCNIRGVGDHVFFYGTLMAPFNRPGRQRITPKLTYKGRGTIRAALFDLGIYPAAIPADDNSLVWGEVYETSEPAPVLAVLDEIEGYRPNEPDRSLYTARAGRCDAGGWARSKRRGRISTTRRSGSAQRITSGDYLDHLNAR